MKIKPNLKYRPVFPNILKNKIILSAKVHKTRKEYFSVGHCLNFTSRWKFLHVITTRAEPLKEKYGDRHYIDAHKQDENPRQDIERF